MSYIATRAVHHDNKVYKSGELIELDPGNKQHEIDIAKLVRVGAAKPAEEVAALNAMTPAKLRELATAEEIAIPEGVSKKEAIIAIIIGARAHRADQEKQSQD